MAQDRIEVIRNLLLSDNPQRLRTLDRLAKSDPAQFKSICHRLLSDHAVLVRQSILRLLAEFGMAGDEEAEAGALAALEIPELREWAALALGKAGSPASFAILFRYAQDGSAAALRVAATHATAPNQRRRVLALARRFVLVAFFPLRQSALWIVLPTLSTHGKEDLLLEVARRYLDEEALGLLERSTPRILPALQELLAETEPGTAEHGDVLRTIQTIERRMSSTEHG
jgi:HEAT repeat protein